MKLNKQGSYERKLRRRNLSLGRLSSNAVFLLSAVVLAIVALILVFSGPILNSYGKGKLERAFAEAHPGYSLRIGRLSYAVYTNRLDARSVTLSATNWSLNAGRISLSDVSWVRLIREKAALADSLGKAGLDAADIDITFHQAHYSLRCARLLALMASSELVAEEVKLSPLSKDEEIFNASAFRTTRFRVSVPECRVLGLAYKEMLEGKSYRAKSVHFIGLSFDALVNRDKPLGPFVKSPLMVSEALAAIRQPLEVNSLVITNGHLKYAERVIAGAEPGIVTFTGVNIYASGITNRGKASAAILLRLQGNLMNAGLLTVQMTIPLASPDFALHYSGTLGAMDLIRLDAFLDNAERIRIKSGSVQKLTYKVDVTSGRARGYVRATYKDFKIAVLDKKNGTEYGLVNQFGTFMANAFKLWSSNTRDASGALREGAVNYTRKPGDEFMQFVWFAVRSGVLDIINH